MIKKQRIFIAVTLALIALMAVLYFTAAKPYIKSREPVSETPETLEGEELGTSNRYYMYTNLERADISSIEVTNKYGSFEFVKNSDDVLVIKGYEHISVDETTLSYLVTTCGSTLSKAKLMDNAPAEKLKEYGLDDPQASWVVTDKAGKKYKVYVGRELLTGGGYYCRFAGRDSVYVLDSTLSYAILNPVEVFVTPYVMFGVSKDDYYTIDNFTVFHENKKVISVGVVPKEQQNNKEALAEHRLTYPAPYNPDSEKLFGIYIGFEGFSGDSTYKLGVDITDLAECGLDSPQYMVSFDYKGQSYYFMVGDMTDDGCYYVISSIYSDIITKVSREKLEYLEYGIMDWISPYIFQYYINSVSEFTVKTDSADVTFYMTHGVDSDGKPTLRVITDGGVEIVSEDAVQNFRQYYKALLSLEAKDYLTGAVPPGGGSMEDFVADDNNRNMYFSYKNLDGVETVYEFYQYTTRRSAVKVNGNCEFYVLSDLVQKIANDTLRILNGEAVESYSKS